jgi:predicted O-linked N-acetylglucosamine transferase (SPINDLY family)
MAHLEVYNGIDVALDTFPWCGHTTACEALWMGVPVVTLRGLQCAGRMTASVLESLALTDLVADTAAAYQALAVALARNVDRLRELRASLRRRLLASPLCDGPSFARKLEAAYAMLWRRWCGANPADLDPAFPAPEPPDFVGVAR